MSNPSKPKKTGILPNSAEKNLIRYHPANHLLVPFSRRAQSGMVIRRIVKITLI
jgi:hypothetical protein